MSLVIAILIIQLRVIITNDMHYLRECSALTQEPIKFCFSGYELSSLIFSKPITNGIFQEQHHKFVAVQLNESVFLFFFPSLCKAVLWEQLRTEGFSLNEAKKIWTIRQSKENDFSSLIVAISFIIFWSNFAKRISREEMVFPRRGSESSRVSSGCSRLC